MRPSAGPVSVVVPVFNETARLGAALEQLLDFAAGFGPGSELVFVDDGSTDGTLALLEASRGGPVGVRVLRRAHEGKGAAVRRPQIPRARRAVLRDPRRGAARLRRHRSHTKNTRLRFGRRSRRGSGRNGQASSPATSQSLTNIALNLQRSDTRIPSARGRSSRRTPSRTTSRTWSTITRRSCDSSNTSTRAFVGLRDRPRIGPRDPDAFDANAVLSSRAAGRHDVGYRDSRATSTRTLTAADDRDRTSPIAYIARIEGVAGRLGRASRGSRAPRSTPGSRRAM